MHPAAVPIPELAKQCDELRTRRSGPGGQHRNKVETTVVLIHRPTGVHAEASERRSQAENRDVALQRLRLKLALEHREPASVQISKSWQARIRSQKLQISASHDDYPTLVAEALDQLQSVGWQMAPAANTLGITTSQLVKLFQKSPAAWTAINKLRTGAGLTTLK
jgi:hypothetical protein